MDKREADILSQIQDKIDLFQEVLTLWEQAYVAVVQRDEVELTRIEKRMTELQRAAKAAVPPPLKSTLN